ncbi:hypothetical protein M8818_006974 [Zalaria obscura]|uniref:Uncharacterized protein n=1 Tax=Zalaria obscura TaxID=2024903 RepID=A0ACC3S7B1_9PEZI
MPLVVPGLMGTGGDDKLSKWQNELMGKKLGDQSDQMTFAKKDLPQQHRVIKEGDMSTQDFNQDRLNIHVGNDGTVNKVTHG